MTYRTRRIVIAVVAVLSLFGAACSSEPQEIDPAQGDGTRLGVKNKGDKGKGGGGSKSDKPGATGAGSGNGKGKASGGGVPARPQEEEAEALVAVEETPTCPLHRPAREAALRRRPIAASPLKDPQPGRSFSRQAVFLRRRPFQRRQEGGGARTCPRRAAGSRCPGVGDQFEMRFTFGGSVPDKMPDKNTIMVIGFGISAGGNDTYGFTAQGTQEGWKAYAGAKDGAKRFPGQFLIQGDTITMRVPWKFINGPRVPLAGELDVVPHGCEHHSLLLRSVPQREGRAVPELMADRDDFQGRVVSIYVGPRAKEPMARLDEVRAVAGRGLEGDRYFNLEGTFSKDEHTPRQE